MRIPTVAHAEVWKFPLHTADRQAVQMPAKAQILTAQTQNGVMTLWALVNPTAPVEDRLIEILGTGYQFQVDGFEREYIGTTQLLNGSLVFHVFELLAGDD